MEQSKEIISFLDVLDLDENVVDSRLKTLMERKTHSDKHLFNALQMIQYKIFINNQDKTDCENVVELEFVAKLIKDINPENAENVCRITTSVLSLNASTLVSNAQHLLQQLISIIDFSSNEAKSDDFETEQSNTLLYFKVCDSVLDAIIGKGLKIDLPMMEVPLERAICHTDEKVKIHFITSTVPKMFEGILGFNILDRIWSYIKELKDDIEVALKVLSCLSDYYLPAVDEKGIVKFESDVVNQCEFWSITLFGLMSTDFTCRKISVYLAKRAIDYLSSENRSVHVKSDNCILFSWDHKITDLLKIQWDNFFILMDSLEEKQSNIVLPSLQLFCAIDKVPKHWVNCAFNLGLKHDNTQVRLKCVEHQLNRKISCVTEATVALRALDDIGFYENHYDVKMLKEMFTETMKENESLLHVVIAIPEANLSPVPLFHFTNMLAEVNYDVSLIDINASKVITELIKAPCNIIALRKAIHFNITHFIAKACKELDWKSIAKVLSLMESEGTKNVANPLVLLLESKLTNDQGDTKELYEYATNSLFDVDFGLMYLDKHHEDISLYSDIIHEKINKINDIVCRQYANKLDCFNDTLIIFKIFSKCSEGKSTAREIIKNLIIKEYKTILQYVFSLLSSDTVMTVNECKSLFHYFKCPDNIDNACKEILLQLYKSSVILLNDINIELEKAVLSMFMINSLSVNESFVNSYKHEMLYVKDFIDLAKIFGKGEVCKVQSIGRLKNILYEKHSETVNLLLEDKSLKLDSCLKNIVDYIDATIECGGYGCLYWILKIVKIILKQLIASNDVIFDVNQFLNRMWKEIEELKSDNHDYSPCMEEFIHLITHESLLDKPEYNNTVILYCNKIVEYGLIKNNPLYYLTRALHGKEMKKYGHLVNILGELMLHCPVSRKDQRITENLAIEILRNSKYSIKSQDNDMHFNFEIQYTTISILSRIHDSETLDAISLFIINKIDDIFKHKVRYHGNSQLHRTIQSGLQHLVFITLVNPKTDTKRILNWSLYLLGKLPHQPSVRICLEWCITLCLYVEGRLLDDQLLKVLKSKYVPVTSQFMVLYWLLKHRITNGTFSNSEYEFVMDTLLSNTMGQLFIVRLHAQYLATKLSQLNEKNKSKYDYTIEVIKRTLDDNANDKTFMKLKEDYFANEFDAIGNLTPYFVYNTLPKLCDSNNNEIDNKEFVSHIMNEINNNTNTYVSDVFKNDWTRCRVNDDELAKIELNRNAENKQLEELEKMWTLQKKYVPWKNMSDVNVYETTKKRESPSDLIVVASLIDKLPNLGGMARTSEVFGVKTYVIDSLRHLQDKQFQGLSVSAERWIDVEEIRPGQPLKDYLNRKKAEGFAVVAAEQTSTGSKLQKFSFPRKTLLLLGHEKEGIPCDLLPMMDHCVEIPQQGFVRSLNVHVTAAIFVWEYARQHLL